MEKIMEKDLLIRDVETKNIMTKSSLPVGGYSVNPYVGCTHGCKYCYASFMKRFTGHTEPWGTFLDIKHWPAIKNPRKYKGQRVVGWRNRMIKEPFMSLAASEPEAVYITFNKGEVYIPSEIAGKSIGVDGDIGEALKEICLARENL